MRSLGDVLDRPAGPRSDDGWADDRPRRDRLPPPSADDALRLSRDLHGGDRRGVAGAIRRPRLGRWRGHSPWCLLAELFVGGAIVYGIVLGGHADNLISYVGEHGTTAATQVGFTIGRVTIEGQSRIDDEDIVRALRVGGGDSMLSFDTAAAQRRLEELPWVREAEVMRLLPSTLHVIIAERRPYARWQLNGRTYLIDGEGAAIADADAKRDADLPLVVGEGGAAGYRSLVALLARHHTLTTRLLAAIRVADRRWTLKLHDGIEILLPEERVADALDWITEADRTRGLLSAALAAVDLRLDDRVTIRLSDEAAARRNAASTRPAEQPGRDT